MFHKKQHKGWHNGVYVYSGKSRPVSLKGGYVKGGDGRLKTEKQDMGSKLGL